MSSSSTKESAELNPLTTSYEFMGPPGALLVTLGVPFLTYVLYFSCSEAAGGCPPPLSILLDRFSSSVSDLDWWKSLWDTEATLMYLAWYAFCVATWFILPGDWIEGVTLRTGEKKKYRINGFSTFLLTLGLVSGYIFTNGPASFTFIYEKWVGFVTASIVMSVVQGLYCYITSFGQGKLLALGGNTGNLIYDFYIGRELNPSIGSFDIKSFNELRPGLILWTLIDISMVCEQAVRRGGFSNVTDSMWLVLFFHTLYVADALYNEPAIFTTMDIITDGFGFMLAVGDLAWVPFVYSLQARYLVFVPVELGWLASAAILVVNFTGYYIFRAANGEKNDFRNGKNPKNLQYFQTKRGTKLLTSGWWGLSRHPNYFGDLLMALAWSLPTGFNTLITYFYVIYFAVLLAHRQIRDDENCEKKYGHDWETYKKMVPYRIVPLSGRWALTRIDLHNLRLQEYAGQIHRSLLLIGPQIVWLGNTRRYHVPWAIIAICYSCAALLPPAQRYMLNKENEKRDGEPPDHTYYDVWVKIAGENGCFVEKKIARAFLDLTDRQNRKLRYVL